jgi:glucose/arabinose dehydrogenase
VLDLPAAGVRLGRVAATIASVALAAPAGAAAQATYRIPPDNPFVGVPGARGEVYLYGMRNPYRWSFDRQTGDIYVGDVGGIMEEITFLPRAIARGANLGWNCFSGTAVQSGCTPLQHVPPAFEYPSGPDVVIGGYVVRDPTLPSFQGQYLFGRFQTGIRRLGPGATGPEQATGANVTSVSGLGEDGLGRLYAVSLGGGVYRLQEQGGSLTASSIGSFTQPVAVAAPPGDSERLFIVEKPGRVQLRTGTQVSLFLDIADLVGDAGGEEGLLAFAVAPDYASSGRVFAFYTDNAGDLQLDEFRRTASSPARSDPASRRPVLTIPHRQASNHNGGQLLFGPDNYLYLSTGDGGPQGDPEGDAQNLGSLLGKVLRIDPTPAAGTGPQPVPPTASAAGTGPQRVPQAARADTTAPRLRTRVKRRQRVLRLRGAVAYARCDEACTVAAGGTLRIGRRAFRLRRVTRPIQVWRRGRLKVGLTRRSARALRKAVRRRRRASVRVRLRAVDLAGNRSPLVRATVRVRR